MTSFNPDSPQDHLLACLDCGGQLQLENDQACCPDCSAAWPALRGIPDFRDRTQAHVIRDLEQAAALDEVYDSRSRDHLVVLSADMGSFYHDRKATPKLRQQRIRVRQQWQASGQAMANRLQQIEPFFLSGATDAAADIGAGSGLQVTALAARYRQVVGIDASMSELLLARKLLDEQGINNVGLACAYAEQLPLSPVAFDFAVSLYVLEHVNSASQAVGQVRRVLKPGASFYFAVPYRYTFIPPEPHTHVWWVGWLPRPWQAGYVRLFKSGFDFDTIHLFSFKEITNLIGGGGGVTLNFFNPGFQPGFPPTSRQGLRLWKVLSWSRLLLGLAGLFLRKSIHAVMTLPCENKDYD